MFTVDVKQQCNKATYQKNVQVIMKGCVQCKPVLMMIERKRRGIVIALALSVVALSSAVASCKNFDIF